MTRQVALELISPTFFYRDYNITIAMKNNIVILVRFSFSVSLVFVKNFWRNGHLVSSVVARKFHPYMIPMASNHHLLRLIEDHNLDHFLLPVPRVVDPEEVFLRTAWRNCCFVGSCCRLEADFPDTRPRGEVHLFNRVRQIKY